MENKALSLYVYFPTHSQLPPSHLPLSRRTIKKRKKKIETQLPIQQFTMKQYLQFLPPPKSFPLSKFQFWYCILFSEL